MKVKNSTVPELSLRKLRSIERNLGVYLANPRAVTRSANQQFGVFDEDELHVGDICADARYFTEEELTQKIKGLFA